MCKKYDIKLVLFAVPPRVGGWIEISSQFENIHATASRPVWAGGLKLRQIDFISPYKWSRPVWAGGLKYKEQSRYGPKEWSRPVWAGGLKCRQSPHG